MPVSYIDRYAIRPEDWQAAEQWVLQSARHLGYSYDKQTDAIYIFSSDDPWTKKGEDWGVNPEQVTLYFGLGDVRREPYLRSIQFDVGGDLPLSTAEWKVSETSGDPPSSLEELLRREEEHASYLAKRSFSEITARAKEFPAFFELYTGIMQRIFPQVEHEDVHTDTGYTEAKASSSHIKKEIWRTDLLTKLQGLRFPSMEIEELGWGKTGVRVIWQPQGHTNYQIWFNLVQGEDPKVCAYVDPTLSGSTTGWLSTRLLKNENALVKLPFTVEQWAVEDMRKKTCPAHWRGIIRELLRHHIPRDMEEAWGAIRRQLVGVEHYDVHTDTGYFESRGKHLTEAEVEEVRYYGIATGDGNSGISHSFPDYIVLTNKPWDLAHLAAHAQFKDDPAIQEWVKRNMEIDGDEEYGISVVFPESPEAQKEREGAYEEYEKRRDEAEAAGEEFEEEDPSDDMWAENTTWFMIDIFPMEASEVDRLSREVYDNTDHPDWLDSLWPPVEHEDVHTDTEFYESAFLSHLPDELSGISISESPSRRLGGFIANFKEWDLINEPAHVDMRKGEAWAKFWLNPVSLSKNEGLDNQQLKKAFRLVRDNEQWLFNWWQEEHANAQRQNPG